MYTILSVPDKWVKLEKKLISTGKLKNSICRWHDYLSRNLKRMTHYLNKNNLLRYPDEDKCLTTSSTAVYQQFSERIYE